MKTVKFEIVKINRLWIEAKQNSYKCKIKISELTKDLAEGSTVDLLCDDISIRSKYGVDLRYEVKSDGKQEKIFLKADYNEYLIEECRNLGGVWDKEAQAWVFDSIVSDKVEDLEEIFASEKVNIELKALKDIFAHTDKISFLGIPLARAFGRDSGAKLCEGISLISGKIDSSGSMKNWYTLIKEHATFRLSIPENVLETFSQSDFEVKVL